MRSIQGGSILRNWMVGDLQPSVPEDDATYTEYRRRSIEFIEARNRRIAPCGRSALTQASRLYAARLSPLVRAMVGRERMTVHLRGFFLTERTDVGRLGPLQAKARPGSKMDCRVSLNRGMSADPEFSNASSGRQACDFSQTERTPLFDFS